MSNFDELILRRRSIRKFDPEKKLCKEDIKQIISAAVEAPSWGNFQTSRYYAILTQDTKDRLCTTLAPYDAAIAINASALIVTTFVRNISGFRGGEAVNELENGWGIYDLGLQNALLLLKVSDIGLDSIVLGLRDAKAIKSLLNIPQEESVVSVIAIGYRLYDEVRPKRVSVDKITKYY